MLKQNSNVICNRIKIISCAFVVVFVIVFSSCSDYTPVEAGNEYSLKLSGMINDSVSFNYYTYKKGLLMSIRRVSDGSDITNEYTYDYGKVIRYKEDFTTSYQNTEYYYNISGLIGRSISTSFNRVMNKVEYTSETMYEYDGSNRIVSGESMDSHSNNIYRSEVVYGNNGNVTKLIRKFNGQISLVYIFEYDSCENQFYCLYPFSGLSANLLSKNNMVKQSVYEDNLLLAEANYHYKYNIFRYPINCVIEIKNYDDVGNCIEKYNRYQDYFY